MVVDGHMHTLSARPRAVPSRRMRVPTCQKPPSFLASRWSSVPGWARSKRTTGTAGPWGGANVPTGAARCPRLTRRGPAGPHGYWAGPAALARRQDLRLGRRAQPPRLPLRGGPAFLEVSPPICRVARLPAIPRRAARAQRLGPRSRAYPSQHRVDRAAPRLERIAHALRPSRSVIHVNHRGDPGV